MSFLSLLEIARSLPVKPPAYFNYPFSLLVCPSTRYSQSIGNFHQYGKKRYRPGAEQLFLCQKDAITRQYSNYMHYGIKQVNMIADSNNRSLRRQVLFVSYFQTDDNVEQASYDSLGYFKRCLGSRFHGFLLTPIL